MVQTSAWQENLVWVLFDCVVVVRSHLYPWQAEALLGWQLLAEHVLTRNHVAGLTALLFINGIIDHDTVACSVRYMAGASTGQKTDRHKGSTKHTCRMHLHCRSQIE